MDLKLPVVRASTSWRSIASVLPGVLSRRVVLLYVTSRLVTTALFLAIGPTALPGSIPGPHSDLLTQLTAWDGFWFQRIAGAGYPSELPRENGAVIGNAWAFLPLYPLVVKGIALGHITLWPLAAVLVSTVCGLAAALLLAELVRRHAGDGPALTAALLFSFGPASYVLQTAYAESMGLMLLFLLLLLVDAHRYWSAAGIAVLLAFTRPGMQAVALLVGLHLLLRIRDARRGAERFRPAEAAAVVVLGLVAGASGFVWPFIAGLVTGERDAYLATELSWRAPYTGSSEMGFFTPWLVAFTGLFGGGGPFVLIAVLVLGGALLLSVRVRRLGTTIGLFAGAWLLYLLAVFYPQSSTWRLLMPAAGLGGAVPLTSRRRIAVALVVAVALQAALMWNAYGAVHGQYSPP